jgi:hypothetical protein
MQTEPILCPLCKGRQMVDCKAQKLDPGCRMCAGVGYVSEEQCLCGKPVIFFRNTWQKYCNTKKCQERVEGTK